MPFDPVAYDAFELGSVEWSTSTNTISLGYRLRNGPTFTEQFRLDGASLAVAEPARTALGAAMRVLHLCASTSYYKTAAPPEIVSPGAGLSASERDLLTGLVGPGLAEFRHTNRLDQRARPTIRAEHRDVPEPPRLDATGTLVPMGGGKDSLATTETLRRHGYRPVLFVLGGHRRILDVCEQTGLDTVVMYRQVDPVLARLNKAGALEGHVPISAIVSATALVAAICVGADAIVMSNERSASDPNLVDDGIAVNHQFSKSLEFETAFRRTIRESVSPSIEYFSLLRRSSELRIARFFAGLTDYHDIFVSCNDAFGRDDDDYRRWCGNCPKCRFLFVALAPFLSHRELVGIFGWDLLDDERHIPGYLALLGIATWPKPFDCVGSVAETRLAFSLAAERTEWREAAVPTAIRRAAPQAFIDVVAGVGDAERLDGDHHIPARFAACAEAIR